jgi:tricarballylate dehydrogenase
VFAGVRDETSPGLARQLGLDTDQFMRTINEFNEACRPGNFNHTVLDDCKTEGVTPAKTHWARPIDVGPFFAYAVRPGITFTYLGFQTDESTAVHFSGRPSPNLFAAGELMSGNVLGKGYTAGVGMTIGTAFGRIAGTRAAAAALGQSGADTLAIIEERDRAAA